MTSHLGVAVIGAGYWGPNLVRNFTASDDWGLIAVCDLDVDRAARVVAKAAPGTEVTSSLDDVLRRDDVDAIAIATPARTHERIALQALEAGKHVLVEKPLADSAACGEQMVRSARDRGLVLMADHTYCYTPAVSKIRELIGEGVLGDILFIDSVRINLGLIQPDVNVLWDLAPHDLSVLDFVLGGLDPIGVSAQGADPIGAGTACVGHLNLALRNGALAHIHVNWMSPTKIRQLVVGGSKRTLVWDDLNLVQRLSVFDRGVELIEEPTDGAETAERRVAYRVGDTWSPALKEREALSAMVEEFATAIHEGRPAVTDGEAGLRILRVLEAAGRSMAMDGRQVDLDPAPSALAEVSA